jgi:hypothetical protein
MRGSKARQHPARAYDSILDEFSWPHKEGTHLKVGGVRETNMVTGFSNCNSLNKSSRRRGDQRHSIVLKV